LILITTFPEEPALWLTTTENLLVYFSQKQLEQDLDALNFKLSAKTYEYGRCRYLNTANFYQILANGEQVRRRWMIDSEPSDMVFCYTCKLFSSNQTAFTIGYNNWKNIHRLAEHENSTSHREAITACCSLAKQTGRVDEGLLKQLRNEQEFWRNVLKKSGFGC
jgi:hypothetical protein